MKPIYLSLIILWISSFAIAQNPNPNKPNNFQYIFMEAGLTHSVALKCNGSVVCWGSNLSGQLGNNNAPTNTNIPVIVSGASGTDSLTSIIGVAAGDSHTLALRADSTVWAWGSNAYGQLGDNTTTQRNFPVQVHGINNVGFLTGVVAIACGGTHSLAILSNGTVVAWGYNSSGQLGDNTNTERHTPVPTTGMDAGVTAVAIAAGDCHTMVLQSDGRLKTCGCDNAGQLGDDGNSGTSGASTLGYVNTDKSGNIPLTNIIAIAAGAIHSLALDKTGIAWSWGSQSAGSNGYELGRVCNTPDCKYAGQVSVITNGIALAAGKNTSFALTKNNYSLMVWGDNTNGELGTGDNIFRNVPTPNTLLPNNLFAVAAGGSHAMALLNTDTIKTFGLNSSGELGNGNNTSSNTPQTVLNYNMGMVIADAGPDVGYCSGDSARLGAPGNYSIFKYRWTPATGLTAPGTTRPDTLSNPWAKIATPTFVSVTYVLTKTYRSYTVNICIQPDTVRVSVTGRALAQFSSSAPACVGESVSFVNTGSSGSAIKFSWNFGADAIFPPGADTLENPTGIIYSSAGLRKVTLTITSLCGGILTIDTYIDGVNIFDQPTSGFNSNAPVCSGSPVNFNNTGSSGSTWSYFWDFGAGASPATSTAENPSGITYSSEGTKNITFTITNGKCTSTSSQTIVITQTPVAAFSSTAPSCTGDSVSFLNTGTSGATYSWNFGSGATPANSTVESPAGIVYSSAGIKTVKLITTLGSCSDSITQTFNIAQTPAPAFISNAPQCKGSAVTFNYAGTTGFGWTYIWDFGTGATPAISSAQNPSSVVYSSAGIKTVTLTVANGTCSKATTGTATINIKPIAGFSSTAPSCTNDSVSFLNTGTAGATFAWNFGSGAFPATSTVASPAGIVYSSAGIKTVQLVTTLGACTDTSTQTINIYQTPAPAFTSNAPQCQGSAISFNYTGTTGIGWTYLWDFGTGATPATSSAQNPGSVLYSSVGTKTVTLTVTNNNQCPKTITGTIAILTTPVADFSSTAPQCTGLPVDFTDTGTATGVTWSWVFGSGATPLTSTVENPTGVIYSTAGTKIVVLSVTNVATACTANVVKTININQTPVATFTSNAPQCEGSDINFTNTGTTGGNWSFLWDFGQDATPQTATSENPLAVTYGSGGTKTITFTISDANCTQTSTQIININPLPVVNAGRDTVICNNTSLMLGGAPLSGNYSFSWFPPDNLSCVSCPNPFAHPIAPTTIYILTVTNSTTGCKASDSIVVTMLAPLVADAGVDGEICLGDKIQIGSGLITGQNYSWTPATGLNDINLPNPIANPSVTTIYTLSVTGPGCGPVTDEVTVIVHPLPLANAGKNDTITVGSAIQLTATGGVQYNWSPSYGLSNIGIFNPVANPTITTAYTVTVTDIYGCIGTSSATVFVIESSFWLPKAFTPDDNQENDVLYVRGNGITNFEFAIFNRWGEQIFYSKEQKEGWDGTRQGTGEKMPEGAYAYYIKGMLTNGTPVDAKGLVNLIR